MKLFTLTFVTVLETHRIFKDAKNVKMFKHIMTKKKCRDFHFLRAKDKSKCKFLLQYE